MQISSADTYPGVLTTNILKLYLVLRKSSFFSMASFPLLIILHIADTLT